MLVLQRFVATLNKGTESEHIAENDVGRTCAVEVQLHQTRTHNSQVNLVMHLLDSHGNAYKEITTSEITSSEGNVFTTNNSKYVFDNIVEAHVC